MHYYLGYWFSVADECREDGDIRFVPADLASVPVETELRASVQEFLKLLDDEVLVRNIKDDAEFLKFTAQSLRIVNAIRNANTALAAERVKESR